MALAAAHGYRHHPQQALPVRAVRAVEAPEVVLVWHWQHGEAGSGHQRAAVAVEQTAAERRAMECAAAEWVATKQTEFGASQQVLRVRQQMRWVAIGLPPQNPYVRPSIQPVKR